MWSARHRLDALAVSRTGDMPVYCVWLVLEGSAIVTVGGRSVSVEEGSICLSYLSQGRQFETRSDFEWLSLGLRLVVFGRSDFFARQSLPAIWRPDDKKLALLRGWMEALIEVYGIDTPACQIVCGGLSRAIFGEILTGLGDHFDDHAPAHGRMPAVLELLNADPGVSVTDLAKQAGYSPAHFRREVRRWTGSSPHEFVTSYRLDEARRLLLSGDLIISAIAEQTGFQSLSHFTRLFRDRYGIPPGRYRLLSLRGEVER